DRLNRLIDKILDLEKFETGKQKIFPTRGNLINTISKSISPLHQLILNKNIHIEFDEYQNNVMLHYDEERIIQVITNLVSNAIKFTSEKDGVIILTVIDKPNDYITVTVFNNGKGVNTEDLESIFDKFYQSSSQTIKKPIGSGLGLAISKQIIEAHKGKIWAENVQNGVVFSFTLYKNLK
ncbi:MAG: HAMP domain-containing histidine kinase, partial [Flavobacterium sp.]|nr:HAMP domain-containing histidine kinase [Flavobacterium sp.]